MENITFLSFLGIFCIKIVSSFMPNNFFSGRLFNYRFNFSNVIQLFHFLLYFLLKVVFSRNLSIAPNFSNLLTQLVKISYYLHVICWSRTLIFQRIRHKFFIFPFSLRSLFHLLIKKHNYRNCNNFKESIKFNNLYSKIIRKTALWN